MIRLLLLIIFDLILCTSLLVAQTVTGKVTTAAEPNGLPGVSILVKGTSVGSLTDINGAYSIEVPLNGVLVFSFVGHETQEYPILEKVF